MNDIAVTVRFFGAFRQYGDSAKFPVPSGATVQTVKDRLAQFLKLSSAALVNDSVLACDDEIVGNEHIFTKDCDLAILPPVCGG